MNGELIKVGKKGSKYIDTSAMDIDDSFVIKLLRTDFYETHRVFNNRPVTTYSLQCHHGKDRVYYIPSKKVKEFIEQQCKPGDTIRVTKKQFFSHQNNCNVTYYNPTFESTDSYSTYPQEKGQRALDNINNKPVYKADIPSNSEDPRDAEIKRLRDKSLEYGKAYSKEQFLCIWIELFPEDSKDNVWKQYWDKYVNG